MATPFFWKTADGIQIYAYDWSCDPARAVIALVHGLGEHVHRYEHLAKWCNARQMALVGYDRRGHGQSGGKRGHTPRYGAWLDEVAQLLVEVELRYPDIPVFLYGHSMGGNLVLNYVLRRHPTISGVIATAPHIRLAFTPNPVTVALGKLMRRLAPGFTQPNGLETEALSRDRAVVEKYIEDPLVHDRLTAAAGIGLLEAARWLDTYRGNFPLPLLLMHGGADRITSPEGTKAFTERVGGEVSLKIWDGFYHEIHNEPEHEQVLAWATDWLKAQTSLP